MRNATRLGVVVALGTSTVLAACGGKGDNASTDTAAAAAASAPAGTTASAGTNGTAPAGAGGPTTPADSVKGPASPVPTSTGKMTDPEIVSLTQAADEGEIMTSKVALTKATNPDVRKFAQQMIADHTQMISQRNALGKAQNLKPAAGAKDSIGDAGKKMTAALQAAPKGMAFDTAYVNGQVMAHTNTLAMVQKAEGEAQNAALKGMLTKAAPIVQKHLDAAKSLQSKLAGSGATASTGAAK
ncbi:hypothetical protein tb265_22660 [Gemmatimonadetes bacterium T265]|nr:hypothetical protein tb265_22660 [Gemmatimonadetes bacterium T265]